jgi:hypothetical protein
MSRRPLLQIMNDLLTSSLQICRVRGYLYICDPSLPACEIEVKVTTFENLVDFGFDDVRYEILRVDL